MLEYYILLPCVVASIAVGILVTAQNVRSLQHSLYGALSIVFVVIAVANTISLSESKFQEIAMQTVMAFTSLGLYVMYLFVLSIHPASKYRIWHLLKRTWPIALFTAIVFTIDLSPYLFREVIPGSPPTPIPGYGVLVYIVHFLLLSGMSASRLYGLLYNGSLTNRLRQQIRLVLIGLTPIVLLAPLTSFLLPVVLNNTALVMLSPVYTLFFVLCVGYAIARHGMFDIRMAAVRTLAYILSLLTMAGIYFGLAYIVSSVVLVVASSADLSVSPLNMALALVLAFIFQPIKKFFDRITNAVFYRDRYNSDEFMARVGVALTSTTDIRTLLRRVGDEIASTLKAQHATFIVVREDALPLTTGSADHAPRLKVAEVEELRELFTMTEVYRRDSDDSHAKLDRWLKKRSFHVVVPLGDSVGWLLLGEPKAGAYASRDLRVLKAISSELMIAIQNSRSVQVVNELNAHLQQRIDAATRELRSSNEKLRKLDETKDEFVSMASHQLRTPLTSIKGYISMLLEGDGGKITPQQGKLLNEAFTSSERMVRLIGDFLNVSRLQTGKFMIDAQPADLARVIGDEIKSMQLLAKSHGLTLHYDGPKSLPDVMIDEDKTRQVIMNFIDNAIYYSHTGSDIVVKLSATRGHVVLEVRDQGIGVPKKEQGQLFTKFFRAENARRQRPDGTGVGLFLAKRVIEAQGGEIIFHSRPGFGSVFGFKLPLKK